MRNIKMILAVIVLSLSADANAGNLFTCKLPGNKVSSVSIDGAQIYYSYGKEGAQPDVQLDRTQSWFMGNNHYAGANYQLTFRVQKGNYNYVLYSQNYGDKLDEGLVAYKGTKILFNKKCTESAKVDDSVWSAQPDDFGMQEETDQTSDLIGKLDNGTASAGDNAPSTNTQVDKQQQNNPDPSQPVIKANITSGDFGTNHINIFSVTDQVTITGLVVNRGNCESMVLGRTNTPTLKYGESAGFTVNGQCNIMEFTVNTSMGNYTFNINQ
ncbi:hypothetical protein [Kluyvera georgiana]|uniref:hypothetical protein n=1 Tax=Kluyvera georgiana TaxID=73098 RepID=UPI0008071800|nr:hypothetical protein [Kluyvera georgiana]